jgi:hypothetical protein
MRINFDDFKKVFIALGSEFETSKSMLREIDLAHVCAKGFAFETKG